MSAQTPQSGDEFAAINNAPVRFWVCPVREHGRRNDERGWPVVTVEWHDNVAYCTAPGCVRTSADMRKESAPPTRPATVDDTALIERAAVALASGNVNDAKYRHDDAVDVHEQVYGPLLAAKDERIAVLQRSWDKARDANTAWLDGRAVALPVDAVGQIAARVHDVVCDCHGNRTGITLRSMDLDKIRAGIKPLIESWRPATEPAEPPAQADATEPALRDRVASLFPPKLFMAHRDNIADGVMTVVQPVLARKDAEIERLRTFLGSLVDPDDCRIVDGGCQAHGYLDLAPGEQCRIQVAKDMIVSWPAPATEPAEATERTAPMRRWRDSEGHVWVELEPGTLTGRASWNIPSLDVAQAFGPLTRLPSLPADARPLRDVSELRTVDMPYEEWRSFHRDVTGTDPGPDPTGTGSAPFGQPYESCVLDGSGTCSRPSHTHDATPAEQYACTEECRDEHCVHPIACETRGQCPPQNPDLRPKDGFDASLPFEHLQASTDVTPAEKPATEIEPSAPRVWHEGDAEPIEDGLELATPANDVFSRSPNGEWVSDIGRGDWAALTAHFKELTEVPTEGGDRDRA